MRTWANLTKEEYEEMEIEIDNLQSTVARQRSELTGCRGSFQKFYDMARLYERAIKKHARGECDCAGRGECLTRLVSITPANDRPTLRVLRKRYYTKAKR